MSARGRRPAISKTKETPTGPPSPVAFGHRTHTEILQRWYGRVMRRDDDKIVVKALAFPRRMMEYDRRPHSGRPLLKI
ncbi:hypothetical protein EVAR_67748_1 [Eumeta japonica]|uniref:Uncharacterized protein n=1 Tax=Eumeta variegata TaxID=151549 RepID=A0A4C1ZKC7_EUMVA|nr:hypothetical protein EVAR_67748_1 [Eumeta japonica]